MDLAFKAKPKSSRSHPSAEPLKHKHSTLKKSCPGSPCDWRLQLGLGSDVRAQHDARHPAQHLDSSPPLPTAQKPLLRSQEAAQRHFSAHQKLQKHIQGDSEPCSDAAAIAQHFQGAITEKRHSNGTEGTKPWREASHIHALFADPPPKVAQPPSDLWN